MRSAELDWAKHWGVWPDTAQAGLENILAVADERQGVAFTPLEPTPGVGGRRVIYVIGRHKDAARSSEPLGPMRLSTAPAAL